MSRLIVKNLPPYVTPDRLRQHFEQKGGPSAKLTDVKVSFKPDGTSRRFGFVGFKTAQEATKAREWFDRTYIYSARIAVNVVEDNSASSSSRPSKRRRMGPSPSDAIAFPPKGSEQVPDNSASVSTAKGKQLDDFMEVMQPRNKKGPSWANDPATSHATTVPPVPGPVNDSKDIEMQETLQPAPAQEPLSDLEWMKQRMSVTVDKAEQQVFEQSDDEDARDKEQNEAVRDAAPVESQDPVKQTILQTSRLFVRNLTFSCTEEELAELFRPYGDSLKIHLPTDLNTKQGKGFGYVTFASPAHAVAAYEALDKKPFQGRVLHILGAVDRNAKYEAEGGEVKKATVKEEKHAKRKALAGKEFNWSMLYMNSDAVASSVADRMNIPKTAILNPEPSETTTNPAVKLALAETHIIQETKSYLESHGVILSSFSSKARSDTVILVKNIPYGTSEVQIRELFEPHGELTRVLVPPAGTIAVVEFARPDEAAKGFKAVAYRRLGNSIVYLEKGPMGMFMEGDIQPSVNDEDAALLSKTVLKLPDQDVRDAADNAAPESVAGGTTLYIKNLAFATTQERLVQVFSHLPSFSFARLQTKPDPNRPGSKLSMGYGFVGFKDVEGAKKALTSMQGFVLDGHELHVKFAGRGKEEMEKEVGAVVGSKARTTKMIVKNLPFEATRKDVRDLFSVHGKLKSVRLPKKFDSRTRGFAFLEFVSRHEAENAFNALKHTHLLGRHLVLEWAEEAEQDLEMLRKKAGVGFGDGKEMPGMKRKLNLGKKGEEDPEDLEA